MKRQGLFLIYSLLALLLSRLTHADDFDTFKNQLHFDTPVQTWQQAEHGSLTLGNSTAIYGFNEDNLDTDNKVKVKVKEITDKNDWEKKFCHLGYSEDNPSGYECKETDLPLISLDNNIIPLFDVDFFDVESININVNASSIENESYDSNDLFDLIPGEYNEIKISGIQVAFPEGNYTIKKLIIEKNAEVVFQGNTEIVVDNLVLSWDGVNALESNADKLTINKFDLNNGYVLLNKGVHLINEFNLNNGDADFGAGEYRIKKIDMSNNSLLIVHNALFFVNELKINESEVKFEVTRNKSNFKINTFNIEGGVNNISFAQGSYYIKHFNRGSGTNMFNYNGKVNIVSHQVKVIGYNANNNLGKKVNIYVLDTTTSEANFEISGSEKMCTNVFSRRKFSVIGSGVFTGSVIANEIELTGSGRIHYYPGAACTKAEIQDEVEYELNLIPDHSFSLICETQPVKIQVLNEQGQLATDFSGELSLNWTGTGYLATLTKGSAQGQNYSPDQGELIFDLTKTRNQNGDFQHGDFQHGDIGLTVNFAADNSKTKTATYSFVPYKFEAKDQYLIADRPQTVKVKARACNGQNQAVDLAYSGTPTITAQWQEPTAANASWQFALTFSQGIANAGLSVVDAGWLTITLTAPNFSCPANIANCPIEGGELQGQFNAFVRPWVLAVCNGADEDHKIESATGNASSGVGFLAAGAEFGVKVLPLAWQANSSLAASTTGNLDSAQLDCSGVTQQFFKTPPNAAQYIELNSELASPNPNVSDALLESSSGLTQSRANAQGVYSFEQLQWDEVGSLNIMAQVNPITTGQCAPSEDLGFNLAQWYSCTQTGEREVGRFYPAYFKLEENSWQLANQNDIAYLSQPFDRAEVILAPYTLKNTVPKNYAFFAPAAQAQIELLDDADLTDLGNVFLLDVLNGQWQYDNNKSQWRLEDVGGAMLIRKEESNAPLITEPNGPFNTQESGETTTQLGVRLVPSDLGDPVNWQDAHCEQGNTAPALEPDKDKRCDLLFNPQPPARYGRLTMADVSGATASQLTVPLLVEYWNGTQFVRNLDDKRSRFDGKYYCSQRVWELGTPSSAVLAGTGTVQQGLSQALSAQQQSAEREQVRLWLKIQEVDLVGEGSNDEDIRCYYKENEALPATLNQPWLSYNWRGLGDEDPSTLVTFGVYRGNDRVLFRNEPGLVATP